MKIPICSSSTVIWLLELVGVHRRVSAVAAGLLLELALALNAFQANAQPEWKNNLARNNLTDDFALSERFKSDLKQDYASMKAVLSELGLAK